MYSGHKLLGQEKQGVEQIRLFMKVIVIGIKVDRAALMKIGWPRLIK